MCVDDIVLYFNTMDIFLDIAIILPVLWINTFRPDIYIKACLLQL